MRRSILLAALSAASLSGTANADTLATLYASQVATRHLDTCFDQNYRPGQDKSSDGGKSKKRLLEACSAEADSAAQACQANTGKSQQDCRKQAGTLADDYLSLKSAGIQ